MQSLSLPEVCVPLLVLPAAAWWMKKAMNRYMKGDGTAALKKVVLLTGASSGIGKATALTLCQRGHKVYGCARRVNQMDDLVAAGGVAVEMDVTDAQQIVMAVKQIIDAEGKIDVLINNAGYAIYGSVEDITMDEARRQFEVNIFGMARLTQEVLPHMREKKAGTIINVSSMGGKIYTPFGSWYHATKHALEGFSDCLRLELNPFGIKVAIIEPGIIKTEFYEVMTQPLIDRSKGGPYEPFVTKFTSGDMDSGGSPPSLIANTIAKAVEAKNPKRRYVAGALAKPLMFIRGWLGDGVFDFLMLRNIK
jgi:NAD(P)-dependent dehydrogenase (short-subunit alcohol dehydrogenase family)